MSNLKNGSRADVYQIVTDLIIARLEKGDIPWKEPWTTRQILPAQNFANHKPYRGINAFILNGLYPSPYYLTLKQANDLGGRIKKGSRSIPVVFWKLNHYTKDGGAPVPADMVNAMPKGTVNTIPLLRYYNVFNATQIDGIEFPVPEKLNVPGAKIDERCEQIVQGMPDAPKIVTGVDQAYYSRAKDLINMPDRSLFAGTEQYYAILFHEMIHSTGHTKRLDRDSLNDSKKFGDKNYSLEELVAEMGASFLVNEAGMLEPPMIDNSAAYIQNWLTALKNDKTLLIKASGLAQKAADFVLNRVPELA